MIVEIVSVGTEIIRGEILNSNARYIAQECGACGIAVYFHTSVDDDEDHIVNALQNAFSRADCVITTGGLGPTIDDLTKEVSAAYLQLTCVVHEPSLMYIRERFTMANREMPKNNEKQAYFPKNAHVLPNPNGTAPGCIMQHDGKTIINLPGPPREMEPMFQRYVLPFLQSHAEGYITTRFLHITGIGESTIDTLLSDLMKNTNPALAPYAKEGEVSLRITATSDSQHTTKKMIISAEEEIRRRIGDINVFGTDHDTLESAVVSLLIANRYTIALAESCTGGLCTARLVNVPGVSSVLKEGIVCYSNDSKIVRAGVSGELIGTYGAVSKEVAEAMALGIAASAGTDVGVGITGVAGPGQSESKPAGLVYIAVSIQGIVHAYELQLHGSREKNRIATVTRTLDYIRRQIIETSLQK